MAILGVLQPVFSPEPAVKKRNPWLWGEMNFKVTQELTYCVMTTVREACGSKRETDIPSIV